MVLRWHIACSARAANRVLFLYSPREVGTPFVGIPEGQVLLGYAGLENKIKMWPLLFRVRAVVHACQKG